MADVTISALTQGTPAGNNIVPYSTGSSTLGTPVSALFQESSFIQISTQTYPNYNYTGAGSGRALLTLGDVNRFDSSAIRFTQAGGTHIIGNNRPQSGGPNQILNTASNADFVINNAVVNPGTSIIFATSATERMCINKDGSVGIGTTTPAAKLDVNGDIKCTSTVINGVRTLYFSGLNQGTDIISRTVYLNQGNPVKVQCSFNHWSQQDYNATRESYISASHYADPYVPMLVDDILSRSSALGGGWSFSRPVTNANPGPGYSYPLSDKLVITKSAGTYGGSSTWWIKIEGNATSLGVYPT